LDEAAKHGPDSVYLVTARQMVEYGAIKGIVVGTQAIEIGNKH
jgi:hypothetical protein